MHTLDPTRRLSEEKALHERFPMLRLLSEESGTFVLEGPLDIDGETRWIRIMAPSGYPSIPPQVKEIRGCGGDVLMYWGRDHQFADGTLCLFPHGNHEQSWRHDRLAVDAIEQFVALVRQERQKGAQTLVFQGMDRLVIAPGSAVLFKTPQGRGELLVRRPGPVLGDMFVDEISEERLRNSQLQILSAGWRGVLPQAERVFWLRAPLPADWRDALRGSAALDELLGTGVPPALRQRLQTALVAVLVRESDDDNIDALVIRRRPDFIGALDISEVEFVTPDALVFHRTDAVLPQRSELAQIPVIFAGLGSLGSTTAVALARAGVAHFVLLDPEILQPENLSRHIGTVRDLGRPKVDVVEEKIRAINPDAQVIKHAKWLTWDLPAFGAGLELETYLQTQRRALIISTCAEPHAERSINGLAIRAQIPVIFAAALGAAEHGRIFRVLPGTSACYACVCATQEEQPERFPRFALATEVAAPYVQPALPGLGVDIAQIAMLTARFALQTLSRAFSLDLGLADERSDHLLWTNRGGWLFDCPLQARAERFLRRPDCPVCGERRNS